MQILLKDYFRHANNADPLIVKAIILNEHKRAGVLAEIVEDNLCSMRTTISLDINDLVKHLESGEIEQSTKAGSQHG